ncbi:hypothetical protein PGB90_007545 [Kerria lacca]
MQVTSTACGGYISIIRVFFVLNVYALNSNLDWYISHVGPYMLKNKMKIMKRN